MVLCTLCSVQDSVPALVPTYEGPVWHAIAFDASQAWMDDCGGSALSAIAARGQEGAGGSKPTRRKSEEEEDPLRYPVDIRVRWFESRHGEGWGGGNE